VKYQCAQCLAFVPLTDLTERGGKYLCLPCAEAWDARRWTLEPVDTGRIVYERKPASRAVRRLVDRRNRLADEFNAIGGGVEGCREPARALALAGEIRELEWQIAERREAKR
jgi:hypothetical protein